MNLRLVGLLASITLAGCGLGANDTSTGRTSSRALAGDGSSQSDGGDKGTSGGGGAATTDGDPCGDVKSAYQACLDAKADGCDAILEKLNTCGQPPPVNACGACQPFEDNFKACTLKDGADCGPLLTELGTCLTQDAKNGGTAGGGGGPVDPCEPFADKYKACAETSPGPACDDVLTQLNQCEAAQAQQPPPVPGK